MFMTRIAAALALAAVCLTSPAYAVVIAGWDQNGNANANAGDGFGFVPGDFPQPNDHGTATAFHSINPVNATTDGNGLYTKVDSFAGDTLNDIEGAGSGGSFSFIGGSSNGSQSIFTVPTTGYEDITVSWAQRGTSTGFTSRVFEYSSDAGDNWTNIGAYTGSSGALSATWTLVSLDLSSITALDDNEDVMFRITYSGAAVGGADSGNNRQDNFYVQGTELIPEPASVVLLGLGLCGLLVRRRFV